MDTSAIYRINETLGLPESILRLVLNAAEMVRENPALQRELEVWLGAFRAGDYTALDAMALPGDTMGKLADMFPLIVLLHTFDDLRDFYISKGIPMDILRDTLHDVTVNIEAYEYLYGQSGAANGCFRWLRRHFLGELYQLGRLQFVHYALKDDFICDGALMAVQGQGVLDVHIPKGGRLAPEACADSYRLAEAFYSTYFPDLEITGFTCTSWLLAPNLRHVLPAGSNILCFQNDYRLSELRPDDRSVIRYVFERNPNNVTDLKLLPEDTSLRRKVKAYMLGGGTIGCAKGFRNIICSNEN